MWLGRENREVERRREIERRREKGIERVEGREEKGDQAEARG